jgi:hypothetical protein
LQPNGCLSDHIILKFNNLLNIYRIFVLATPSAAMREDIFWGTIAPEGYRKPTATLPFRHHLSNRSRPSRLAMSAGAAGGHVFCQKVARLFQLDFSQNRAKISSKNHPKRRSARQ